MKDDEETYNAKFAFFFLRISYEWRKVHLVYATNGQSQFAGRHTCQLMMKSMVQFIKKEHTITYGTYDVEATTPKDYPEALRDHVGNSYGGKFFFFLSTITLFATVKIPLLVLRSKVWQKIDDESTRSAKRV